MEIKLPRLGEGADTGTVASVFVREGDQVRKDQPLLELESEKAVASIPSPAAGTIARLHVKEGDVVKVGQLIATLSEGGAEGAAAPARAEAGAAGEERAEEQPAEEFPPGGPPAWGPFPAEEEGPGPRGIPPAAPPSVRKIARELGIDLTRVRGSERGGRIVLADVRRYIQQLQQMAAAPRPPGAGAPAAAAASIDFSRWGAVRRAKMTTLRRTISARMVGSWSSIPHITQFDEADITAMLALRKKHAPAYERQGAHLTLTPMLLRTLAPVLKRHPLFNASLDEAAGEIVYKDYLHVGIAVDTEHGLIVPVIRDVDRKSLLELAREVSELAQRTRDRKAAVEEMQGGSFTISNQGGIGSAHFTPIINAPQVAILGIGRGVLKPVVAEGAVVHRTMLPLSLSYDHRVIDGADAARFMVDLVGAVQAVQESDISL